MSFNAMGLACNGLGAARSQLYSVLERLEIRTSALGVSIGRVDYAVDFYAPDFELIPDNFVMHSNAVRSDHYDALTLQSEGTSRRVTTVRVGKMPGRQVTIYDKRAEVIVKRKPGWWKIWNSNLAKLGLPPLDPSGDPASNRVWRVELRAGKKHLKNRWGITTWADLDDKLGDVYNKMLDNIRYCEPTYLDKNRSRWPPAPIWERVKTEIQNDLCEMVSGVEPSNIRAVHKNAHRQMLVAQTSGLITSIAALDGTNFIGYPNTVDQVSRLIIASAKGNQTRIENGIEKAKNRYVFLDDT